MRAVVQRVSRAAVLVDGKLLSAIGQGLLVLLGVGKLDRAGDVDYLVNKIGNLRIFGDFQGRMHLSVKEIQGEMLVVSQFTLYGDCRHGRRPDFTAAAPSPQARELYELFLERSRQAGIPVACGQFQAEMQVELVNDGPVTILLDSQRVF